MKPEQAGLRQSLQAQLDALAKLKGFTPFEVGQTQSPPALQPLRSPTRPLEPQKAAPLPHSTPQAAISKQEPFFEHPSHTAATSLLEPYRRALGAAYSTLHLLARWSIEHATEQDPAPHLMTCYWTLEEALGLCERTLRRHLVEAGHPWSDTVLQLIDLRHNYGEMLDGKDEDGKDRLRPCITSMVIRFFPQGRYSPKAKVKRWGRRDLLADSDEGRTRPTRPQAQKARYERQTMQMSAYSSVKKQSRDNNWLLVKLGQTVSERSEAQTYKPFGSLYADIPKSYVLDALKSDLELAVNQAAARGASVTRARSRWVDMAAKLLAERHQDHRALPHHESERHITHYDGFTDLWRLLLWTAIKAEMYGGTEQGWWLVKRMVILAQDAADMDVDKPSAWAWVQVREEVLALRRDYGSGMAGTVLEA